MLDLLREEKSEQSLLLNRIKVDGGTQMRAGLDEATVDEYTAALNSGARFPPIVVFYDGNEYWLGDGFHRVEAYKRVYREIKTLGSIACDVRSGTRRDAVLYAAGANSDHGLRRSKEDKRRAVETLLRDEEWAQWSNREIARRCKVDEKTVRNVRQTLTADYPQLSDGEGRRYVDRYGSERVMATTEIGAAAAEAAAEGRRRRNGLTKDEYALQVLAPGVTQWLRHYGDRKGRTWRDIGDVAAHSNSLCWQDVVAEWTRRKIYFCDDTMKRAIEVALSQLKGEDAQPMRAPTIDYDEPAIIECPQCGAEQEDHDGFGVLHCETCGYCAHASATGDICDFCGKSIGSDPAIDTEAAAIVRKELNGETGQLISSLNDAIVAIEKAKRLLDDYENGSRAEGHVRLLIAKLTKLRERDL